MRDLFPASYGTWSYTGPTDIGHWVEEALMTHSGGRNLKFYAKPNPVHGSEATTSTLHWDVSKMRGVKSIEIHARSASGPLLAGRGQNAPEIDVAAPVSGYETYVLIDTTDGRHDELGAVTLERK